MVTGVVAACAVILACAAILRAYRRARVRSDRRLEAALLEIDGHLKAISTSVAEAIDRFADARSEGPQLFLTLDFDELVDSLVAEAAARTGADAVALRVDGPGGRPIVASLGPDVDTELLERTFGPPDARPFRAATTDWTYAASEEPGEARFHTTLVTPLGPEAGLKGDLTVYSTSPGAFQPQHAAALRALIDEAVVGLTNARRFAEIEARTLLDPATGVPNARGYQLELGREVARAHRTGRPLSVVLVGIEGTATSGPGGSRGNGVADVARLLTRVTRKSDISCRRGEREFAILLPETREAGATMLTSRLQEEAKRTLGVGRSTLAVGFVEWHSDETTEALDARAEAVLGRPVAALAEQRLAKTRRVTGPAGDLRRDALESLAREVADAHRLERTLALVVLDVDGLGVIAERLGREAADSVLGEVARHLDESVAAGSVHRLGQGEFALVLSESTAHDAEALLGAVQGSLSPPPGVERVTLCAGITELAEDEDAAAVLARAERALAQAKQVGQGTVVVAVPGPTVPRPH
jgi:diguanylate cyclase (GGDEF)-like protein